MILLVYLADTQSVRFDSHDALLLLFCWLPLKILTFEYFRSFVIIVAGSALIHNRYFRKFLKYL